MDWPTLGMIQTRFYRAILGRPGPPASRTAGSSKQSKMHDLFGGWFVAPPWGEFDPEQKVNGVGESVTRYEACVRVCLRACVYISRWIYSSCIVL